MWWNGYDGLFILKPKHAAVFRWAADSLSDFVGWDDDDDEWPGIGVTVFDALSQGQKQAAILSVVRALLDPNVEAPAVTAIAAGTVDAIYHDLQSCIETEIALGESCELRRMMLEAMEESDYWNDVNSESDPDDEPAVPPPPDCTDLSDWEELVVALRTDVLEDYDFDMADDFLDMAPDKVAALKQMMNIHPDYFVSVADDPSPEHLADIWREIRERLR